MRLRLHLVIGCATTVITAAVLLLNVFFCNFAQAAEDVDYAKIGWWRIIYREVDNLTGCQASVSFNDQTEISIALIQDGYAKDWHVYIFNPHWVSWIGRKSQHTLLIVAVLVVNSMQLARDAESDDPLQDVGSLQNDFWDCRGSIPAARGVGSRDPRVAAADHRAATR